MTEQRTILYIEDDPGSQTLVQRTLSHAGYRVVVASRGIEGLDIAARVLPDLILMDINLPDLSGREVTTRLRGDERFRNVPIVALTAQSQAGEREKAIAAGLTGYLNKPVDVDRLAEQIAAYLAGSRETLSGEALTAAQAAYNQEVVSRLEAKIRELERNYAELQRLDKIKEDFIQMTAHELRTPMTTIYGYGRLLQESAIIRQLKDENAEVQVFLDGLLDSIERMTGVINEILTISRIATGRVELAVGPLNFAHMMEKLIKHFAPVIERRKLVVHFDVAQWPTLVHADADLITLAISNLIGNAIKYTPDGGTITLTAREVSGTVQIAIKDTGIGIDRQDQTRIFDQFFTADNTQRHSTSKTAFRGGGLGLGLAICRGIIEAHGGRIWVESEGRDEKRLPGSTFHVNLPLQARATSPRRILTS